MAKAAHLMCFSCRTWGSGCRRLYSAVVIAPDSTAPTQRTSSGALVAFGVAAASYACLWGVGGLLAVALGWQAKREIRASGGALSGGRLAVAAMLLGGLNLVLVVTVLAVAIPYLWRSESILPVVAGPVAPPAPALPTGEPSPHPSQHPSRPPSQHGEVVPGHYSEDTEVRTVTIGRVALIDVGPEVRSLSEELTRQRALAGEHGGQVLVWVVAPQCGPCNGVSAALSAPTMQQALETTRLVRVDRTRFAAELHELGIPYELVPGFALLTDRNRPRDFIHGGEWDEDIAANIAPVLSEFVRGNYKVRRQPWLGIKRRDETAL